jgi:V/A-type H+-transporting ATPase subunit B
VRLSEHVYRTVITVAGPLLFVEGVLAARAGELVRVVYPDGREAEGEVLVIREDTVLIEIYGDPHGLDTKNTSIVMTDSVKRAPLSPDMIGRVFDGSFRPADGRPMFVPDKWSPISGFPINPASRARPLEFIETGYSAIDGLNSLVKGQKLPIFSCPGLPSKELAAGILQNAKLAGTAEERKEFVVVFAALGLIFHEYSFYMDVLKEMGTGFVAFVNLANEPVMERLIAPRFALTSAEYLAFELGMDVLVVITDITNYCDALREVSSAREELPGRRGYPGYMYSDLASLYERAGRIKGLEGSVTMLPVVTMPEDDITHPIPDLTGYITEGQIVLSRDLHRVWIFPPIDVLPSLSRLMHRGIGKGQTRADHKQTADLLYKHYARGRDLRRLEAIVGREGMTESDRTLLDLALAFEREFINQPEGRRGVYETLDKGRELLGRFSLLK